MVEDTVFQQDLPHANSLSPGVNAGRLLDHPVYQFSADAALSKGDEIQRTEKSPLCRESGRKPSRGEPSEKRDTISGNKAKKVFFFFRDIALGSCTNHLSRVM